MLKPGFADPAYPGERFYCWHCALMEGVLASFPALSEKIDIARIDWEHPRPDIMRLLGEDNQSLPVLLLGDDADAAMATGRYGKQLFAEGKDAILAALSRRHGIPLPHP